MTKNSGKLLVAFSIAATLWRSSSASSFGQTLSPVSVRDNSGAVLGIDSRITPVRLEISRYKREVTVYRGANALRRFSVAVGRSGWETPLGKFQIFEMIRDPAWEHPLTGQVFQPGSSRNELGRFWIGFWTDGDTRIGFHDTPHPETVGKPVSHGCIRMRRHDIEELFREVNLGTAVAVVP